MPVSVFAVEAIRVTIMAGVAAVAGVMALHDARMWLDPPAMFVQPVLLPGLGASGVWSLSTVPAAPKQLCYFGNNP